MIAIDMEMPVCCMRCRFYDAPEFKAYCRVASGKFIGRWDRGGKPKWCPLIPVDGIIKQNEEGGN